MKKTISFIIVFLWIFSFANANCIDFDQWKVCISLQNNWEWNYQLERQFTAKWATQNLYMLSCRVLTPSWKFQNVGSCDGKFQYDWNWSQDIRYYIDFQEQRKVLNSKAQFVYFNSKQWQEFNSVYSIWPSLTNALKNKFPALRTNTTWNNLSDSIYSSMKNIKQTQSTWINSYSDFYSLIENFITYTIYIR